MQVLLLTVLLALFLFASSADVSKVQAITVTNVDRDLDISSQIVKESLKYEIENTEKTAVSYFLQSIEATKANNLAFIEVTFTQGTKTVQRPEVTTLGTKTDKVFYKIAFPESLAPGKTLKFTVDIQYSRLLRPFPSHIYQKDQQFVEYTGNVYVTSVYPVKKQTTVVKLSPGSVESYSKVQPVKQDTNKLTYGPYENVEADKFNQITIHYENNSPFLVVTKLMRWIEVSHWGNVAVEETLDVSHVGAQLKGPFSRFEYQRDARGSDKQPCVKSFKTVLPASAKDVYYRDEIGNISTSNLRQKSDMAELEIRPRFPLFGGWKTNYYIGYNVPSYEYLFSSGNRFALKMRFIDHIFKNYVVDDITVKIVLPEGAKDIEFKTPYPVERLPDEIHYTYLDFTGRPVIVARKKNLVENHIKDFQIHYTFDRTSMIREPLMILAAFFLLFLTVIIYVRLDFTIVKDGSTNDLQKSKISSTSAHVEPKSELVQKKSGKKL